MAVDLGKQIGPLPLGAWIVVVGTGLGIAYYTRRSSSEEPVEVEDGGGVPGVGTGAVGGWTPTTPGAVDETNPEPEIKTNEDWYRATVKWLIAKGYDPNVSDSAIRKYLAGQKESVQEYTLRSLALQHFGPPPYPLPPGQDPDPPPPTPTPPPVKPPKDPPKPPPAPPPAQYRTYTVQKWPAQGSTLFGIAQIMYGNGSLWPKIYNANRDKISNPNLIHPGWVLKIPP